MTLRVTLEIVPFGNETEKRVIETINISNISFKEKSDDGCDVYVVERNSYKTYDENNIRIHHYRKDGALLLSALALKELSLEENSQ